MAVTTTIETSLDIRVPPHYDLVEVTTTPVDAKPPPFPKEVEAKPPPFPENVDFKITTEPSQLYDALIVGAGPAGLSAALGLCRLHRTTAVFSNGQFRNEGVHAMHNVASRDGEKPVEFRGTTREQILRYGLTDFFDAKIVKMSAENVDAFTGFEVRDQEGRTWKGRKLILTMGSKELLPPIPGYAENWPDNMQVV